jgi:hypothetical protein
MYGLEAREKSPSHSISTLVTYIHKSCKVVGLSFLGRDEHDVCIQGTAKV